MSVASLDARLLAGVYRAFGEAARWIPSAGDPVEGIRVRRTADEDAGMDFGSGSRALVDRIVLRVRVSELAAPAKGGRLEILDDDGEVIGAYVVADRPLKVRYGQEWRIEAEVAV